MRGQKNRREIKIKEQNKKREKKREI